MKVLFLTVDDELRASSRTRVYQFLPYLKDHEIKYDIVAWNGKAIRPLKPADDILKKTYNIVFSELVNYFIMASKIAWALLNIKRYDVVFVQKITLLRLLYVLRLFRVKYVYDIDDAIYTLHSAELAGKSDKIRVHQAVEFMKSARHMTVELPSTEEVAKQNCRHVTTILGPIDTKRYHPSDISKHNAVTIGWIGSLSNTFYLFEIKETLEKLCRKYPDVEVKLIGTRDFTTSEPKIKLADWSLKTEIDELATFDIGLMPLTDDEWSRGKGSYKLLQYMALGIPSVASPVGINNTLIREGENGYLAKTPADWERKLSTLIENKALREQMGKHARQMALDNYSLEASAPKFVKAIKEAYND